MSSKEDTQRLGEYKRIEKIGEGTYGLFIKQNIFELESLLH